MYSRSGTKKLCEIVMCLRLSSNELAILLQKIQLSSVGGERAAAGGAIAVLAEKEESSSSIGVGVDCPASMGGATAADVAIAKVDRSAAPELALSFFLRATLFPDFDCFQKKEWYQVDCGRQRRLVHVKTWNDFRGREDSSCCI